MITIKLTDFNRNSKKILIGVFILSVSFIIILHAALTTIMRQNLEQSAINFTQELTENIYLPYDNTAQLAAKALEFINDYKAVKINIYDLDVIKVISSNENEIEITHKYTMLDYLAKWIISEKEYSINDALNGKKFSQLIISATINHSKSTSLLRVALPIHIGEQKISEAIEIYYDVSQQWEMLANTRLCGILLVAMILLISYILLNSNLIEAQQIINKQYLELEELNSAFEKAQDESKQKSEFLANISHELRTPLNAIIGFSDIIKSEAAGPVGNEQYKEYANDINISGNHLLGLINDILDYSKASANKLKVESIQLDINKIIVTSLRMMMPRAQEAGIELNKIISDQMIIIKADPKRLKQCLFNLLSNAVKFTPNGGKVTISTIFEDQHVIIKIEDTGIGIAEKDLAKVMTPFGQIDNTLSRKYAGTGLGLPLTKKLIELMNGEFSIESKLNIGTNTSMKFTYFPGDKKDTVCLDNSHNSC